ncbi:hypothetical protein HK104_005129, partial [Borealophlyctis nickersoniae]
MSTTIAIYTSITVRDRNTIILRADFGHHVMIPPGAYAYVPSSTTVPPLKIIDEDVLPIIPRCDRLRLYHSTLSSTLIESATTLALETHTRAQSFKFRLAVRDNGCAFTGEFRENRLVASHVLARGWWHPLRRDRLPLAVYNAIAGLEHRIDDIQNGFMLERNLAKDFEAGYVAIKRDAGEYVLVALHKHSMEYDGKKL